MKRLFLILCCLGMVAAHANDWPQWRGPAANGASPTATPPTTWDEQTNLRWKTAIPGRGHSSPVVWDQVIYLTTAIPTDKAAATNLATQAAAEIGSWMRSDARLASNVQQFAVLAISRQDGRLLWCTTVAEEAPQSATHADGSWASGSCVTDGQRIYAHFGSQGLYCLDRAGKLQWQKRFGQMKTRASFGEGSSPALHGQTLLVNWDQEGPSFLVALDKHNGQEQWRVPRQEQTSWATPLVTVFGGQTQVVVSATKRIRSYDLADGKLLWECAGMTGNVIPSPLRFEDTILALSGFRGAAGLAIKLAEAQGDITDKPAAFAWKLAKDMPYTPSPVLLGQRLYFVKGNDGQLGCVDARTGQVLYINQPLDGTKRIYASLVAAAGKIYVTGTEGRTHVLKDGPAFELLATNKLDDRFTASAALAGADLILRGEKHLYCVGPASR